MRTSDLDYHLPPGRIATQPATPRDAARLLVADRSADTLAHHRVRDLATLDLLRPGDLLLLNTSRVLPAAFDAIRVATAGRITGLYLHGSSTRWTVMLRSGGRLRPGERLRFRDDSELQLTASLGRGRWDARYLGEGDPPTALARLGRPPLPPYLLKARRDAGLPELDPHDLDRYQNVFASPTLAPDDGETLGSVAAPTAGLHFTPDLLDAIRARGVCVAYVTLHVGAGTFLPIRADQLDDHDMHAEWFDVPAPTLAAIRQTRLDGGRVIAVGTTTVRAIESVPPDFSPASSHRGQTRLLIAPGPQGEPYPFRHTDALLTNFHLPRSTLLALVAALPDVGLDRLLGWYQQAITHDYRFYSYGDAMLIL